MFQGPAAVVSALVGVVPVGEFYGVPGDPGARGVGDREVRAS